MTESENIVLAALKRMGAVHKGHFVFTSGQHSDTYVNNGAVCTDPHELQIVTKPIAEHFLNRGIECVIGPAEAAIAIAQWVAWWMNELQEASQPKVRAVYASKSGESFIFKRQYDTLVARRKCLVVDDLGSTGSSIKKVVDLTRHYSGDVVGAAYICNRGGVTAEQIVVPELFSAATLDLNSWEPEACATSGPCADGTPIRTDLGHGKK